jgi:general secretion pathway protein C
MNITDLRSRLAAGDWNLLGGPVTPAVVLARLNALAPFWVSLAAAIVIGWALARAVWLLYPPPAPVAWVPPPPPRVAATGTATGTDDAAAIVAVHLFGAADATAPAGDPAAVDAPDTTLSLQLRGAIAAGNPRFAHAIIADAGGQEKVYFLNDTLPGGATVQRIEADRVVLARNGTFEVLRLPRLSTGGPAAPSAAAPRPPGAFSTSNVQEMVAQNAAGFLDVIRPQPFMPDGKLKGYRIYPGPNREQFGALGLRPGDLVTEINGVTLNNPAQGMEVFRTLGDTSQITVTVERDGQPTVLSLNMSQVSTLGGATQ